MGHYFFKEIQKIVYLKLPTKAIAIYNKSF